MRIDAHQHFWKFDPVRDAWIDDSMAGLRRDFLPPHLQPRLAAAGMAGCVAVQADQSLAQNDFLLDLAARHTFIRGVVGWVDLRSPDVDVQLERYADRDRFVGVRHVVQDEQAGFMDDPAFRRGIGRLAAYGLTYDILIRDHQLEEAVRLASAFPEQPFVLDHLAKPRVNEAVYTAWERPLRALAALPNVCCKVSGLVTEAPGYDWSYGTILPFIRVAADAFGPDRLLYGSDWPVCRAATDYAGQLSVTDRAFGDYSPTERAAIFGGNAVRFYGLADPS